MRNMKNHLKQDRLHLRQENVKEYKQNMHRNTRVSKSIYPRIFSIKKGKEIYKILKNKFQGYEKAISIKLQNL
jgi:hypothetical protein